MSVYNITFSFEQDVARNFGPSMMKFLHKKNKKNGNWENRNLKGQELWHN